MMHLIKLVNGETLICSIVKQDKSYVTISDPLKLEIVNSGGLPAMMTTYWIPLPDEELVVDIKQEHVILTSSMTTEMKVFYTKAIVNARGDSTDEEQERQKTLAKRLKSRHYALGSSNTVYH